MLAGRADQVADLRTTVARGKDVALDRMLPTRFTFDGGVGSDPWWDFQTDGYGTWLWSVVQHARRHGLPLDPWQAGIDVAVDYLTTFWDRPCYDWWEGGARRAAARVDARRDLRRAAGSRRRPILIDGVAYP